MPSKSQFQSKQIWFNVLSLLLLLATKYGFGDHTPDAWVTEAQAFINIVVNWALRYTTKTVIA